MLEHQVEYAVMAAMKMQRERLKSVEVKKEAVEDFDKILDVSILGVSLHHYMYNWL